MKYRGSEVDDEQQGSGQADTMQLLVPERDRAARNRLKKLLEKNIKIKKLQ